MGAGRSTGGERQLRLSLVNRGTFGYSTHTFLLFLGNCGCMMLVKFKDGRDELWHPDEAGIEGVSPLPGQKKQV